MGDRAGGGGAWASASWRWTIRNNRRILRDRLTTAGYEILEAEDGEKAVEMAIQHVPDLILMDIRPPRHRWV